MRRSIELKAALAWGFAGFGVLTMIGAFLIVVVLLSDTTSQIQAERARNVRSACEAQNARHDNTIRQVDRLIAEAPPSRRARAGAGRAGTVLIIDALAPRRDCDALVKSQVGS